jgi:hypothetical protein
MGVAAKTNKTTKPSIRGLSEIEKFCSTREYGIGFTATCTSTTETGSVWMFIRVDSI